jgi:CDP-glucose 4,6-dehydratase
MLRLDSSKARSELGWKPRLRLDETLTMIVDWHRHVAQGGDARTVSLRQIDDFALRGAD